MNRSQLRWQDRTVIASLDGRDVGNITVPDIPFHFSRGVYVNLAGIGAVGTDESVRRLGIATDMMREANRFAIERGYTCSAVSTGLTNIARRLYARAGNVHLFSQSTYAAQIADLPAPTLSSDATIRPYEQADEPTVMALIDRLEFPFFGTRKKTPERFRNLQEGWDDDAPELVAFVAEQAGEIVGYCGRFQFWSGLESEMFVLDDDPAICDALLHALAATVSEVGEPELRFSLSECRRDMLHFLWAYGFRPQSTYVFMFNILDLQQLLHQLRPLFQHRAADVDASALPAALILQWADQSGTIEPGGSGPAVTLQASRDLMTLVICGTISAWEAYLRGSLAIEPRPTPEMARALQLLLPAVPYQHPAVDRW